MNNILRILAVAAVVFFIGSCRVYRQVDQPAEVLFEDNEISDYLSGYEVYYHSSSGVFNLQDARTSGDTIYGFAVKTDSTKLVESKRNDMNIYTTSERNEISDSSFVAIPKSEISTVGLMGRDGRASFLKSMSAIALLLGIIIALVLVGGLIGLSVWASAASTDSSNTSSDQSSDSGSGGSGSNSGSGTSNSGASGCYIATMVYGSYEAPEVWVLRRFRDNILQNSRGGRWFINWYYSWSPGFVAKYARYRFIHRVSGLALRPLVWLLK